ncbi:MAG: tetratricopeptide repeat protein [Gemmatimonadales bacterium]|nr:tetratricopeptide repeat protein [Gemmatimonadales bacterium]
MSRSRFLPAHRPLVTAALALFPLTLSLLSLGCSGEPARTASKTGASRPTEVAGPVGDTIADTNSSAGATAMEASFADGERSFRDGKYADAAATFGVWSARHPRNVWGQYMLGVAAWKAGDLASADAAFDRALAIDSTHRKSLVNSGRVLLDAGRPAEARARIERALALEPTSGESLRLLGRARGELGETDAAIEAYHQALALEGEDAWAMNNLGHLLIQSGRFQEALPPLTQAVKLRTEVPMFQNNLATALERGGYYTASAEAYRAALAADSGYRKAAVGLERVQGRADAPVFGTLDLHALADQFETDRQSWSTDGHGIDSTETLETDSLGPDSIRS